MANLTESVDGQSIIARLTRRGTVGPIELRVPRAEHAAEAVESGIPVVVSWHAQERAGFAVESRTENLVEGNDDAVVDLDVGCDGIGGIATEDKNVAARSKELLRRIVGVVDLVARRGRTIAFIEVKQRSSDAAAAWALDQYRLRRVAVAAERLAPRFAQEGDDIRIDAMFIVPRRLPRHLANIWHG